jgi:hypothetical protein
MATEAKKSGAEVKKRTLRDKLGFWDVLFSFVS